MFQLKNRPAGNCRRPVGASLVQVWPFLNASTWRRSSNRSQRSRLRSFLAVLMVVSAMQVRSAVSSLGAQPTVALPGASAVTDVNDSLNSTGTPCTANGDPGKPPGCIFGGRIQEFGVDPANSQILFAATEFGGLWKSTNGGASWAHVDSLPLTASNDVKFASSDPSLVIASGAADTSMNPSPQVWISRDGGDTWSRIGRTTDCGIQNTDAHAIAIAPGIPGSLIIFIADDCGILESSDSGSTWSHIDPAADRHEFIDVKVRQLRGGDLQLDTCGADGYLRSTDGGLTWSPKDTSPSAPLTNGHLPCYVSTAPQDPNTVFLTSQTNTSLGGQSYFESQLLESDAGGTPGTWTLLDMPTKLSNGDSRGPDVITRSAFGSNPNLFEVFYDTNEPVLHQTCSMTTAAGTNNSPRCQSGETNWSEFDGSINSVHGDSDSHDLAFDPTTGCVVLEASDGGAFAVTANGCTGNPTFVQSNTGLHALQESYGTVTGTVYPNHTDLYFGTQDNGMWATNDAGATWKRTAADMYFAVANHDGPPSAVLYGNCGCVRTDETLTGALPYTQPPGCFSTATDFGYQSYAVVTYNKVSGTSDPCDNPSPTYETYVTTNAGSAWSPMGPSFTTGPPYEIQAAGPPTSPTFYLHLGNTLEQLAGSMDASATLTPASSGLAEIANFAVNPSNPMQLYATDLGGPDPAMKLSTNAGASWTVDKALTSMVTQGGTRFFAPKVWPGTLVTAIGFDPNSNTIMVGTIDSGIFVSDDSGSTWTQVTGSTAIPRAVGFFFDEVNHTAYAGSAGRGEWRIDLTPRPSTITYTGDTTGNFHDAMTASGQLYDTANGPSSPIVGAKVTFAIGTQNCSSTTDQSGTASCSVTLNQTPGAYSVTAGYAGDAQHSASDTSSAFTITEEEDSVAYTGPTVILQGSSGVTLKGLLLEDGNNSAPISGRTLTLSLGSQHCTATTDANGTGSCALTFIGALGSQPLAASFAGDAYYLPSSDTGKAAIVFSFPSRGVFTLGDQTVSGATPTTTMTWWADTWNQMNSLSGGVAPPSFKGFANSVSLPTSTPSASCGSSWTSTTGNSPPPTRGVPSFMGVLVTSKVTKNGATDSGNTTHIVVVHVAPGYAPNPMNHGTGTIVAIYC